MFGQINKITAVPGRRDELLECVMSGADRMPGCHSYIAARDAAHADVIWVTEAWESAEAQAASMSIPEVRAAVERARPFIAGFDTVATTIPAVSG